MNKVILSFLICAIAFLSQPANALIELGLNYGRKTTSFDANNSFDSESVTGSLSVYFMERLALEMSYTDAKAVRFEKASMSDPKRTTTQSSQIMGGDLIVMFADRKALFQPYVKGGVARIQRRQQVKIDGQSTYLIVPDDATIPSYGAGLRIRLNEAFGVKLSYDVWKTPIGGGMETEDTNIRAGVTWYL